ncbi:hypothetical protein [Paenibacillus sp. 598K]|uniref:hypothetical protein n=1 Tax=Paenibacillus sp. 598K TaxID=1117987 RepID=UPI000FFF3751|nr:hypothetical protein [Paenibacillus sp. 598K]
MARSPDLHTDTAMSSLLIRIAMERLTYVESIYSQTEEMRRTIQGFSAADVTPSDGVMTLLREHEKLNGMMKELINKEIYIEDIMELIVGPPGRAAADVRREG